jgi:hypothetical protein
MERRGINGLEHNVAAMHSDGGFLILPPVLGGHRRLQVTKSRRKANPN